MSPIIVTHGAKIPRTHTGNGGSNGLRRRSGMGVPAMWAADGEDGQPGADGKPAPNALALTVDIAGLIAANEALAARVAALEMKPQ